MSEVRPGCAMTDASSTAAARVATMTRLRIATTALVVSVTATLFAATPAQAEPVPDGQRLTLTTTAPVAALFTPYSASLGFFLEVPAGVEFPSNATYRVSTFSCGRLVASETEGGAAGGIIGFDLAFPPPDVARTLGPTIDTSVEVTHPGYDPYTIVFSTSTRYQSPSCEQADAPDPDYDDPVVVTHWPTRTTSAARVGRRAKVTPVRTTRVGTPRITYTWFVGRQRSYCAIACTYNRRSIRIRPAWRGKPLFLVVSVSDESWRTDDVDHVVRFGRVRG